MPPPAVDAHGDDSAHAGAAVPRLTRREVEVAECLARGLSNREIAGALCISERTAERHVENILAKLDLHSRTQVAVWMAGQGSGA